MQIDDARHHEFTQKIHDLRAGWGLELPDGTDPLNAAVDDDHGGFRDGSASRAVDQCEVLEHSGLGHCDRKKSGQKYAGEAGKRWSSHAGE